MIEKFYVFFTFNFIFGFIFYKFLQYETKKTAIRRGLPFHQKNVNQNQSLTSKKLHFGSFSTLRDIVLPHSRRTARKGTR